VTEEEDILAEFSTEEIRFGIEQYAQVKLQMTGAEFIKKVRSGEDVACLHRKALEVADLVALLPEGME
jgi:hypothetical protein